MEDVERIIDELEEELLSKKKAFISGRVYIDANKVTELLSRLRDCIPQSFYDAMSIIKNRDEIIREAENRADGIQRSAVEQREKYVSESAIMQDAQKKAQQLVEKAENYCNAMCDSVHSTLDRALADATENLQPVLDNMQAAVGYLKNMRYEVQNRMEQSGAAPKKVSKKN